MFGAGAQAFWIITAVVLATRTGLAGFAIKPGAVSEFSIELPAEARMFAGGGHLSPVKGVKVAVFAPESFEVSKTLPMMVISATSDPGYSSSIALMKRYSSAVSSAGWVLMAADPLEKVGVDDDSFQLRYVMVSAALLELQKIWPSAASAPIAFGGYSGGAKHSGVLAAGFAARGRIAVGVFQGGINSDTLALAAKSFKTLPGGYKRIPVFLAGGERDVVATPDDHRRVMAILKRAGFVNVRLEFNSLPHQADPKMLREALKWFGKIAVGK